MAEETANPPPDGPDATTLIPPIDNIHSIPDVPTPEPMLPPNHALPQPNIDTEMPEAGVRSHILSPTPFRSGSPANGSIRHSSPHSPK